MVYYILQFKKVIVLISETTLLRGQKYNLGRKSRQARQEQCFHLTPETGRNLRFGQFVLCNGTRRIKGGYIQFRQQAV